MDFASSNRAAESRIEWGDCGGGGGWGCCELICGAPTTFQGYGIEYNSIM